MIVKEWTGASGEYFTYEDMNRIEANANEVAAFIDHPTVQFIPVTRSDQFRHDQAQMIELMIRSFADELGVEIPSDPNWAAGRLISYADFNRWEQGIKAADIESRKSVSELTWQTMRGRKWRDPSGHFVTVW